MSIDNQAYKDLIYLHIDGQTNEAESQALFKAMAEDSELRQEFDEAVRLDKALMLDKSELLPPPSLSAKVFEKAGFAKEAEEAVPVAGMFSKLLSGVATAVVLSSIAFTGLTMLNEMNKPDGSGEIASSINTKIARQYDMKANNANMPIASTSLSSEQDIRLKDNSNNIYSNSKINNNRSINIKDDNSAKNKNAKLATDKHLNAKQSEEKLSESIALNAEDIISEERKETASYTDFYALASSEIRGQYAGNINPIFGASGNEYLPIDVDYSGNSDFSVTLNGLLNTNYFPNRTIFQSNDPLQNVNLSLSYHYDDSQAFGIELGAEDLQVYEISQVGAKFKFDLKPTLYWLGLSYRYTFNELIDDVPLRLYSQVAVGGSKYGPVTKLGAGLSYQLSNRFTLSLGYNWTSLMYTHMSTYWFTHKTGLNYSISYKL